MRQKPETVQGMQIDDFDGLLDGTRSGSGLLLRSSNGPFSVDPRGPRGAGKSLDSHEVSLSVALNKNGNQEDRSSALLSSVWTEWILLQKVATTSGSSLVFRAVSVYGVFRSLPSPRTAWNFHKAAGQLVPNHA